MTDAVVVPGDGHVHRAAASHARRRGGLLTLGRIVVGLLILSATYDKSGLVVGGTSVSIYKVLLFASLGVLMIDRVVFGVGPRRPANRRLFRIITAFVVIQTLASLAGTRVGSLPVSYASEIYYLIQRSTFLLVPMLALHFEIPPGAVLRLLLGSVLLHFAFIGLQFASPSTYSALGSAVSDSVREDHTLEWTGGTLDFIGLQRSSNYGSFAALFGLLALGLTPRRRVLRLARLGVAAAAVGIVVLGPARAALVMMGLTMLVWAQRTGWLARRSMRQKVVAAGLLLAVLVGTGRLRTEQFTSLSAFFDDSREGSNQGKFAIAQMGFTLFQESPIVGYGTRRFADLTLPLGNTFAYWSEAHSYGLSTLLESGLVGLVAYVVLWLSLTGALLRRRDREGAIVCSLFVGLGVYNVVYDAGALDIFACVNGLAAYYALQTPRRSRRRKPAPHVSQVAA